MANMEMKAAIVLVGRWWHWEETMAGFLLSIQQCWRKRQLILIAISASDGCQSWCRSHVSALAHKSRHWSCADSLYGNAALDDRGREFQCHDLKMSQLHFAGFVRSVWQLQLPGVMPGRRYAWKTVSFCNGHTANLERSTFPSHKPLQFDPLWKLGLISGQGGNSAHGRQISLHQHHHMGIY